ncbi:MAG: sulfatase-like hydrolase/transferase [Paludibacteraceae bacterium]|nr:sulfatase-like hydrolase/transferase [Paludibacteraceae bacterium]
MHFKTSEYHKLAILIVVFAVSIFLQCVIFHFQAFQAILISSIYKNPLAFWSFYLPKISIALFLSAAVVFIKNKYWLIVPCLILLLWSFAELIYFRANSIFLDAYSFTMIGNMNGFWDSIFTLVRPNDLIMLLPLILLIIAIRFSDTTLTAFKSRCVLAVGGVIVALSIFLHILGTLVFDKQLIVRDATDISGKTSRYYNPFSENGIRTFWGFTCVNYISQTSVAHGLINTFIDLLELPFNSESYELSDLEKKEASVLFNEKTTLKSIPKSRLYIILFESFEYWAITDYTTPNIMNFIRTHENIFWSKNVKRQTRGGTSGDGQMIVNTGVLPIDKGATCFRFPGNTYPSLSELFECSCLIIPGDLGCWNQKRMSDAYGIKQNFVIKGNDGDSFNLLDSVYSEYEYVLVVTIASHTPFKWCDPNSTISLNTHMPEVMRNYLRSVHYTDSCMGNFLSSIDTDSVLSNSTIVITGDHTIFDTDIRSEFSNYCVSFGEQYNVSQNSTPLIIYSPFIHKKQITNEQAYQMDIFPTIISLIGCDSTYYWRGFGKDLLNPKAKRPYNEDKAFQLSDKLIRSDYFERLAVKWKN